MESAEVLRGGQHLALTNRKRFFFMDFGLYCQLIQTPGMALILSPDEDYSSRTARIRIETSKGNEIDNYQVFAVSHFERSQFQIYKNRYPLVTFRSHPSPVYNCHGLSFACRRTNIDKSLEINKILVDDNYISVGKETVLPGDTVLYIQTTSGDIIHSGIVVRVEHGTELVTPVFVLSKWGKYKEAVHHVDECPYFDCKKEYFRVSYEQYA